MSEPAPPRKLRKVPRALTACAVLALLLAGAVVAQKMTERSALRQSIAAGEAAGLFDVPEPPVVPDAENFGALPLFRDRLDGVAEADDLLVRNIRRALEESRPGGRTNQRGNGPIDWSRCHAALVQSVPELGLTPGSAEPAADILRGCSDLFAERFAELEAAAKRPHAVLLRMGTRTDGRQPPVPTSALLLAGGLFALKADAAMAAGDPRQAISALRGLGRVGALAGSACSETAVAVQMSAAGMRNSVVKDALLRAPEPALSAGDLLTLRDSLQPGDFARQLHFAIAGTAWRVREHAEWIAAEPSAFDEPGRGLGTGFGLFMWVMTRTGWCDHAFARTLDTQRAVLRRVNDLSIADRMNLAAPETVSSLVEDDFLRHGHLARMNVGDGTIRICASTYAETAVLHVACALEACERRGGGYPAALADIPRDLLAEVPSDVDGRPLRYSLDSSTGRYKLWSVGLDGVDGHGTATPDAPRRPRDFREPDGDWVWQR